MNNPAETFLYTITKQQYDSTRNKWQYQLKKADKQELYKSGAWVDEDNLDEVL